MHWKRQYPRAMNNEEQQFFTQTAQNYNRENMATSGFIFRDSNKDQVYDFPKLTAIISQLQYEFDDYKYTVYRCAAKFVSLQKLFFSKYFVCSNNLCNF